jgi:hypothetical protein
VIRAQAALLPLNAAEVIEAAPFDDVLPPSFVLQLTVSPSAVSISVPVAVNVVFVGVKEYALAFPASMKSASAAPACMIVLCIAFVPECVGGPLAGSIALIAPTPRDASLYT